MDKIVAIVQARMGSTRLPKKVMKQINGRPVLDYVICRLQQCKNIDEIVIATTTLKKDDVIKKYAELKDISYFRGSEEDVLGRCYYAIKEHCADIVVRVTSDSPLTDPGIVSAVIKEHIKSNSDYTANNIIRTYPRGLDVEVFDWDVLEDAYDNATKLYEREHVTPYIYEHPKKFKLLNVAAEYNLNRPELRLTLDTKEDFRLISEIYSHFNDMYVKTRDVIKFLDENPNLRDINKHIIFSNSYTERKI